MEQDCKALILVGRRQVTMLLTVIQTGVTLERCGRGRERNQVKKYTGRVNRGCDCRCLFPSLSVQEEIIECLLCILHYVKKRKRELSP